MQDDLPYFRVFGEHSPPAFSVHIFVSTLDQVVELVYIRRGVAYRINGYLPSTSKRGCTSALPYRSSQIPYSYSLLTTSRLLRSPSIPLRSSCAIFLCIARVFDLGSDGGLHSLRVLFGPFGSVCFLEIYDSVENEKGAGAEDQDKRCGRMSMSRGRDCGKWEIQLWLSYYAACLLCRSCPGYSGFGLKTD